MNAATQDRAIVTVNDVPAKDPESKVCTYKPGGKSLKSITLKVILIVGRQPRVTRLRAPSGNAFHEKGLQDILEQFARSLEREYPIKDFRMVEVGRGIFNFVEAQ